MWGLQVRIRSRAPGLDLKEAFGVMRDFMRRIKLELNEEKTRVVNARDASFDFLGYTFGPPGHYPKNEAWCLGSASMGARPAATPEGTSAYFVTPTRVQRYQPILG
jgi:hypothetical protein